MIRTKKGSLAGPLLGSGLSILLMIPLVPHAQEPKEPTPQKVPKDVNGGVSACATCHYGADERGATLYVTLYRSHEFIRLDESSTWLQKDVHSLAYKTLNSPLAQRMSKRLEFDVQKSNLCLTCHSVDLTPDSPVEHKQFFVSQGVNCNGCHGIKESWQAQHYKESPDGSQIAWRTLTPGAKSDTGMSDLRNPVFKSKLCVSCHVGNPDQGKVITHEMFSAGHPPLPPFEAATYFEAEPRHWGYPSELNYFKTLSPDKSWSLYRFHPVDREISSARDMAAGAIASLRAEIRQLQVEAENAMKPDGDGIDYARFDCYACHHELLLPSPRQERKSPSGRTGRATLRQSVVILAWVIAEHGEQIEIGGLKPIAIGFQEKWSKLVRSTTSRTDGQFKRIVEASKELVEWCDQFLRVLEECPEPIYTPELTNQLIRLLRHAMLDRGNTDPDAALSLIWAYNRLCVTTRNPLSDDKLRSLAEILPLTVRSQPYSQTENGRMIPIPPRYAERMRSVARFDSQRFLDRVRELLPSN